MGEKWQWEFMADLSVEDRGKILGVCADNESLRKRVKELEKENRRLKEEKNRRIMKAGTMPSKERQKKNLNNNLSEYGM